MNPTQNRAACRLGLRSCGDSPAGRIHCVARHSALGAEAIVERLRLLGSPCSYDWYIKVTADSGRAGRAVAPAWLLLALAVVTGRTDHLAVLAHEAGLLTFSPTIGPGQSPALSPLVRQFAGVVEEYEAAMHGDGRIDADEAVRFTRACTEHAALLLSTANTARLQAGLPSLSTLSPTEDA